jgi:opacity protein-like surface antigen
MGKTRALLIAAAIASAMSAGPMSTGAFAADLLLPPPPPIVEPPPPADFGGWYLRGDIGVGINQISDLRSTFSPTVTVIAPQFEQRSIGDSAFIGAGVGYQFNSWFRADVTGEYRTASNYRSTQSYTDIWTANCGFVGARCQDIYNAQHRAAVFLANGYVDLGTWWGITPYVGGGVGVAVNWLDNLTDYGPQTGGYGAARDSSRANFAWAVGAGLAYNVTPNFKVELGYRYLDMGKFQTNVIGCAAAGCAGERQYFDVSSHDIRLGFRYALMAPPPMLMAPPGPLVRKY